ncbi:MAG: biopolymer transporter ExbD [Cytophagaceae bacterium]|nr:biopolymer transporter ExbD [Cytophagaceae bacterium]
MNFTRRRRAHSAVEASSLSDILFFLLLFFLMISTMASPNAIKLLLPQSSTAKNVSKQVVHLSINDKKEYYVERRRVSPDQLEAALTAEAGKYDTPSVVLRIDKANSVQDLVAVADVIAKLNLRMVIATDKSR